MNARVADVMTKNVVAVRKYASFNEIAARFRELQVSAFPVLDDDGTLVGMVSETDLIPKEALQAGYADHPGLSGLRYRSERGKAGAVTAIDLMSRPPVTIGPHDLLSHAARVMHDHKVNHFPVVNQGRLVGGIVSRADVLSVFGRPDEEIRDEIIENVILWHYLTNPDSFTVTVRDGVVTLKRAPETASVGHGIVSAVRHLDGVVAVHDELRYPANEQERSWGAQASW
jgi:CBS domain-containing protein